MTRQTAALTGIVLSCFLVALVWKTNWDAVERFEKDHHRPARSQRRPGWETTTTLLETIEAGGLEKVQSALHAQSSQTFGHGSAVTHQHNASPLVPPQKNNNNNDDDPKFHLVFSTGCSAFQDWQSYAFFYFVMVSGQPGEVTRVASGCSAEESRTLQRQFAQEIETMSPHFHLHLTPDFSRVADTKRPYKFFNKPMGLRHWMEYGLGLPETSSSHNDTIFVLLDPDQIILRPFVVDYANEPEIFRPSLLNYTKITHGQPMAASYAFGTAWKSNIDIDGILNDTDHGSPVQNWTVGDVRDNYTVGPPYVATGADMYAIVKTWAEFVVPVYQQTNGAFLAEMFAYSVAARHLNLPHRIAQSFMLSDPSVNLEAGWGAWIDGKPSAEVCSTDFSPMPHVFHFCQRYFLGTFFFYKYKLPKSKDNMFFSCQHPLFEEPPANMSDVYDSAVTPDGTEHKLEPTRRKRMAFALCQMIPRMNQVATYFKQHHCQNDTANLNKTFHFPMDSKKGKK